MKIETKDKTMTVFLSGEIDHHNAFSLREKTDTAIIREAPEKLILDFSDVSFMDSSGVGFVIGRYKLASSSGCAVAVASLKPRDKKILMLSGMENRIEFR